MKKLTDLLEKNVQWLVLGLAGLYVVYMVWVYVITPPVKVAGIGPEALTPGDIDSYIYNNEAIPLQTAMQNTHVPAMPMPSFVPAFVSSMNYSNDNPQPWTDLLAVLPPAGQLKIDQTDHPQQQNPGGVEQLPLILAANIPATRTGMSNVLLPPTPGAAPAPAADAKGVDKVWVSVRFEIDVDAIAKAFDAAKIPGGGLANTAFLQAVLERQEQTSDDGWSDPTTVPAFATQPPEISQFPIGQALPWNYLQWAEQHTSDILQPAFYQIVRGDPWSVPGEAAAVAPEQAAFDPNAHLTDTPAQLLQLPPEQRQQVAALKQKMARAKRPTPASGSTGLGPRGSPAPRPGDDVVNDPDRPANQIFYQAASLGPQPRAGRPPAFVPGSDIADPPRGPVPGSYGQGDTSGPPTAQQSVNAQSNAQFPIPIGEFDPHKWITDHVGKPTIVCWAHDDTVQPSHTYRYRITYKIKNPLFSTTNVAKDASLTQIFALVSKPSDWSANVNVPSTVNFWIMRSPNHGLVPIQVFSWHDGQSKGKVFDVGAGDAIGSKQGDVDYSTGWTMVDVGIDPRTEEQFVLLMDPAGNLRKREVRADLQDPKFQSMKQQAAGAAAVANPVDTIAGTR